MLIAFGLLFLGLLSSLYALLRTRVPVLRTPREHLDEIRAALAPRAGERVVDAGAADGRALGALCQAAGVHGRGYELNGPVWLFGSLRLLLEGRLGRVRLSWSDFFRAELERVDLVYAYLMPEVMRRVAEKCQEEMPTGARLASFLWQVPGWTPSRVVPLGRAQDPLYVYEIGAAAAVGESSDRPVDTGRKLDPSAG
jgi:hypothetical protein